MIHFTADLHFSHSNIIKYCNRPYRDIEHMDQSLIDNWNSVVKSQDIVFILGDFSFRNPHTFTAKLNGALVFLCGNHDNIKGFNTLRVISRGVHIFMQHYPYPKEVPDKTELILCGHVHDKWKRKEWNALPMINVGVDVWDYKPVSINEVIG